MAIGVRRGRTGDRDAVAHLVERCFEHPWSASAVEGALGDRAARVWLAFAPRSDSDGHGASPADEAVLGFVLARRIADQLEIDLVGVDPTSRRRGVAARLVRGLLDDESRTGAVEARLELSASNPAAAALYAGLGFVVVGRRPRYYPDGSDALLLTRWLA